MDKLKIFNRLLEQLESTLETLIASANDAKAAATDSESQAETKWDTFGLESSYLAGAQAKRAEELRVSISKLHAVNFSKEESFSVVGLRALVHVLVEGEEDRYFFVLPFAGGTKVSFEESEILIITPESPIAGQLMGKEEGDAFEMNVKGSSVEYEIVSIS